MRRIGLINVDGSKAFPNLALMKISAWHKAQGDLVSWYNPFDGWYDDVYLSKVFSFSPDYDYCINASNIHRGGTGYCIDLVNGKEVYHPERDQRLPRSVEHICPDYSLYPNLTEDTAYGFLTRGCPRGCGFCIVAGKEGRRSYKVADLSEFWSGQKRIVLCDPNILACPDWKDLLGQLIDSRALVDFNQGLDIRMLTPEKIELINRIKISDIHFAWDRYQDKDLVLPKFRMFSDLTRIRKKHTEHNAIVYTLVNYDSTLEQDLERIYTLRELGFWAYVMIYDKEHCNPVYHDLQRWVNNRFVFARVDKFEDYRNQHYRLEEKTLSMF